MKFLYNIFKGGDMRQFHIVSCGVSLIKNATDEKIIEDHKISDEKYWEEFGGTDNFKKLLDFFNKDPKKACAELSTFLEVYENEKNKKNIEIYLFGTKTSANEICRKIITDYLEKLGFSLLSGTEVSGYFREAYSKTEEEASKKFVSETSDLLDSLIRLARRKKADGYRVFFNPTGGLKAHVIVCAVAGFLTESEVYYKNEEFKKVLFLPPMIYIPKGKEKEFLKILNDKKTVSSVVEVNKIKEEYSEELERLCSYGMVYVESENGADYRIGITERGKLISKNLT